MLISRLKSKLKLFYTFFVVPPKQWQLPKNSEVLIYDACGAEALAPYLTKYSVTTLALRGESINVQCLLRAVFTLSFWKGKLLKAYSEAFIQAVLPKLVISYIDNNPAFYGVSKSFWNVKTILLQNGLRDNWLEGCFDEKKYHVDYMLVFGSCIGQYYGSRISGEVIPVGSVRNNAARILNSVQGVDVLFISQWHCKPESGAALYIGHDGTPIDGERFFASEVKVLKFLDRWCSENNKTLGICGRANEKDCHEKQFFADSLKACVWKYHPRTDDYSSYKLIDAAQMVVSIDSTLGYEAIARGKRTAIFSCRGISLNTEFRKFGWPKDLPNNGLFWTNDQDVKQFQRVMYYLDTVSDKEWEQARKSYSSELIVLDPSNTRLVALLDQLLPSRAPSNTN